MSVDRQSDFGFANELLGDVDVHAGRQARAKNYFSAALTIFRAVGNWASVTRVSNKLSDLGEPVVDPEGPDERQPRLLVCWTWLEYADALRKAGQFVEAQNKAINAERHIRTLKDELHENELIDLIARVRTVIARASARDAS